MAIAAALVIGYQQLQIGNLQDRVVELERQKAGETQARSQWQEAAQKCTASVGALQARQAAQRRAYEAQLAVAKEATAHAQGQARAILSAPRPPGLDECQAARAELDAEIDRRRP